MQGGGIDLVFTMVCFCAGRILSILVNIKNAGEHGEISWSKLSDGMGSIEESINFG